MTQTGKDDAIWPPQGAATALRPDSPRRQSGAEFIDWPDAAGARDEEDDWADRVAAIWGAAADDVKAAASAIPPISRDEPPQSARIYPATLNEPLGLQTPRSTPGWTGLTPPDVRESLRAALAAHTPPAVELTTDAPARIDEPELALPVEIIPPEAADTLVLVEEPVSVRPAGPGLLTPDEIWELAARELGNRTLGSAAPAIASALPPSEAEPPAAAPLDLLRPAMVLAGPGSDSAEAPPGAAELAAPAAVFSPFALVEPAPIAAPTTPAAKDPLPATEERLSFGAAARPAADGRRTGRTLVWLLLLAALGGAGWVYREPLSRIDWPHWWAKVRETFTGNESVPARPVVPPVAPPAQPSVEPPSSATPAAPAPLSTPDAASESAAPGAVATPDSGEKAGAAPSTLPANEATAPNPPAEVPAVDSPGARPAQPTAAAPIPATEGGPTIASKAPAIPTDASAPKETRISLLMTAEGTEATAPGAEPAKPTPLFRPSPPPSTNPDVVRAQSVVESLLRASSVEEILPQVFDSARVEPIIRSYYAQRRLEPLTGTVLELQISGRVPSSGSQAHVFSVFNSHHPQGFPVSAESTPAGYRVDWETFIQWRDRWLNDFTRSRPTEAREFYVVLQRTHYFGDDVPKLGEKLHFTVKSAIPDDEKTYAFVDRKSPLGRSLEETFDWQKMYYPVVELQWTREPGSKPYVRLNRVVRPTWRRSGAL